MFQEFTHENSFHVISAGSLLKRESLFVNHTSQNLYKTPTEANRGALHLREFKSAQKYHFEIFGT